MKIIFSYFYKLFWPNFIFHNMEKIYIFFRLNFPQTFWIVSQTRRFSWEALVGVFQSDFHFPPYVFEKSKFGLNFLVHKFFSEASKQYFIAEKIHKKNLREHSIIFWTPFFQDSKHFLIFFSNWKKNRAIGNGLWEKEGGDTCITVTKTVPRCL